MGDTVIDSDNDHAIIRGIFKNKRLSLTLKSNRSVKYDRAASDVAIIDDCSEFRR